MLFHREKHKTLQKILHSFVPNNPPGKLASVTPIEDNTGQYKRSTVVQRVFLAPAEAHAQGGARLTLPGSFVCGRALSRCNASTG